MIQYRNEDSLQVLRDWVNNQIVSTVTWGVQHPGSVTVIGSVVLGLISLLLWYIFRPKPELPNEFLQEVPKPPYVHPLLKNDPEMWWFKQTDRKKSSFAADAKKLQDDFIKAGGKPSRLPDEDEPLSPLAPLSPVTTSSPQPTSNIPSISPLTVTTSSKNIAPATTTTRDADAPKQQPLKVNNNSNIENKKKKNRK